MPDGSACALAARAVILMMATTGIALSIVASLNCEFLKFNNSASLAWPTLLDPFDGVIEAHVGLFSWKVIRSVPNKPVAVFNECIPYEERFGEIDTALLSVAQICGFCAPIFAAVAILCLLAETCVCNFFGSFLFASLLLVTASGLQAATFCMFAEQDFCFADDGQSEQQCEVGTAGILSGVAAVLFWVSGLLECCAPRSDPICFSSGSSSDKRNAQQEVVVPVVIDDDEFGEEDPPAPSRTDSQISLSRKNSHRPPDSKIRDEDFDTPSAKDGTRVEVKEKEFPDGSRQVDEITHFPDGSKSVKTKTFKPDEE